MATKSVTLKDSNGDTLYPVTDSNVVNINQQKTLAQALDGVVYAEDPTQNATPTAWVTSSDIDFTQFEAFDIVANDGTLTVTKSYPFKICVMGITSTWGYAGGSVTTSINNASGGATLVKSCPGKGSGGDTIGRNVNCSAIYTCSANTEYTFNIYIQSGGGQSGNQVALLGFIVRTGN